MDHFPKALSTWGLLVCLPFFILRTKFPFPFYSWYLRWLHLCSPSLLTMNHVGFLTYMSTVSKPFAPCLGPTMTTVSTTLVLNKMPWSGRAPIPSQRQLDSAPNWDIRVSASTRELGVWVPIIVKKELTNVACVQTSSAIWKAPGNLMGLQLMLWEGLSLPYLLHPTCQSWSGMSPPPWGISGGSRRSETASSPEYSAITFGRSRVRPWVHIHTYLISDVGSRHGQDLFCLRAVSFFSTAAEVTSLLLQGPMPLLLHPMPLSSPDSSSLGRSRLKFQAATWTFYLFWREPVIWLCHLAWSDVRRWGTNTVYSITEQRSLL